MRISTLLIFTFLTILLASCADYQRIGNLTLVSTRNYESSQEYSQIQRNVEGKAKMANKDALQMAIESAVRSVPEGEFMKNVSVYVKSNGKFVRVVGDVWGIPSIDKNITTTINETIVFGIGDKVAFRNSGNRIVEGTIIGINAQNAIIEHPAPFGKVTKSEIKLERLTKMQNPTN